jgi:hypothetical protein
MSFREIEGQSPGGKVRPANPYLVTIPGKAGCPDEEAGTFTGRVPHQFCWRNRVQLERPDNVADGQCLTNQSPGRIEPNVVNPKPLLERGFDDTSELSGIPIEQNALNLDIDAAVDVVRCPDFCSLNRRNEKEGDETNHQPHKTALQSMPNTTEIV